MKDTNQNGITERPPVIVVVGHVDHGKSSLLDYIRKTNIVEGEAGGITQHLSAYEVSHKNDKGVEKKITFLDTPGHEAFSGMRARGVTAADIAILVVSAEDSVKAQTIEALKAIQSDGLPFVVAINKIDKPAANIDKVKVDLAEHGVYTEGFGGDIPWVAISAKTGQGVPELLDTILLLSEMEEIKGNVNETAEGVVIESHMDPKRGISATLLIKNGVLKTGMCMVTDDSIAPVRSIENFLGKNVAEASFSSPVSIAGFDKLPSVGATFKARMNKKEAEACVLSFRSKSNVVSEKKFTDGNNVENESILVVPLIVKADTAGTLEAIEKEFSKIKKEGLVWKIIQSGAGVIGESDIRLGSSMKGALVIGFNVKTDRSALELAMRTGVEIHNFDIIYKITEWLDEELEKRRPRVQSEEITGSAKILKCFSRTKDRQVVGGRVLSGLIASGAKVRIMRREFEIGRGEIIELQQSKVRAKEISEGEFGTNIESKTEIAPGDVLEAYVSVTK